MSLHPSVKQKIAHQIDEVREYLHDLEGAIDTDDSLEDISVHIHDFRNAYETLDVSLNDLLSHLSSPKT